MIMLVLMNHATGKQKSYDNESNKSQLVIRGFGHCMKNEADLAAVTIRSDDNRTMYTTSCLTSITPKYSK